jgi:hypothetical protein
LVLLMLPLYQQAALILLPPLLLLSLYQQAALILLLLLLLTQQATGRSAAAAAALAGLPSVWEAAQTPAGLQDSAQLPHLPAAAASAAAAAAAAAACWQYCRLRCLLPHRCTHHPTPAAPAAAAAAAAAAEPPNSWLRYSRSVCCASYLYYCQASCRVELQHETRHVAAPALPAAAALLLLKAGSSKLAG